MGLVAGLRAVSVAAVMSCIVPAMSAAQTITVAVAAPVTSIDPHYHNLTPNQALAAHIFEPLVDMDATAHPVPALAESWRRIDDRTWEFKLRRARFHNGAEFTADDVAFTLDRVPKVVNSPSSYAIYTKAIESVQVVDPHTIRLTTKTIYPLLPIDLTQVAIICRCVGPDPATEDFNSGKDAIGTGPFRFVSYKPGDRIELERNDQWWGRAPAWQHVTYRIISNDGARTAALLAGDVQFIEFRADQRHRQAAHQSVAGAVRHRRAAADLSGARPVAGRADAVRHRPERRGARPQSA